MRFSNRVTAASASLVLLAQVVPLTAVTAASPVTQTFLHTGAEQQFVVPTGVASVHVVLVGGRGGHYQGAFVGGQGGRVEGDLGVTPGATLYVEVGGNGLNVSGGTPTPGGFNGGGAGGECMPAQFFGASGGGASDIRVTPRPLAGTLNSRLVVAGGGGGAGDLASGGAAGAGGSGPRAGGGGTTAAGGAGGVGDVPGGSGVIGQGGAGASSTNPCAGAGGGGYFGGGGGGVVLNDSISGGSGGGGSSLVGALTNGSVAIDATGTPSISITYVPVANTGAVTADVDVRTSAACLLLSTNEVSFGTLSLGDEDKASGPAVMIKNCSGNTENVFASGTAATGAGASWSLVDSAETCADSLGLDRYRLLLSSIEFAAPIGLSTNAKAVTTLPADFVSTETVRIFMACPGSSGGGQTMSMSINYLAVEQ